MMVKPKWWQFWLWRKYQDEVEATRQEYLDRFHTKSPEHFKRIEDFYNKLWRRKK